MILIYGPWTFLNILASYATCTKLWSFLAGPFLRVVFVAHNLEFWGSYSPWTKSKFASAYATAKSLQSCPTLCDPIDGSPPGSPVPGILQARTLEWVAISFSNAQKWKVKAKSFSHVWLFATPWTAAYQAPPCMGFSRQEYWSGCRCLLQSRCSTTKIVVSCYFKDSTEDLTTCHSHLIYVDEGQEWNLTRWKTTFK